MAKDNKALQVKSPRKLVEISRYGSDALQGFFALAELEGMYAFKNTLMAKLDTQGWPVFIESREKNCMNEIIKSDLGEIVEMVVGMVVHSSKGHVRYNLDLWLNDLAPAKDAQFIIEEKNMATLEATITEVIEDLSQKYGDPLAVKYHQQSLLKAMFSASAAKLTPAEKAETRLIKTLKSLIQTMKTYSAQGVPFIEFQGRMEVQLGNMQWKIREPGDIHRPLASELWGIASAAQRKTTIFARYTLQDANVPARKPYREAKDFILAHVSDIATAAQAVAAELDKELATPDGLLTRHCTIIGRENKTNFAKKDNAAP